MRTLIIFIGISLLAVMATSSSVEGTPHLIPQPHDFPRPPLRISRSASASDPHHVERRTASPISHHHLHRPFHRPHYPHHIGRRSAPGISELEKQVTKGEYVCGDKICKLTPGEVPKTCPHGFCQYPILPPLK